MTDLFSIQERHRNLYETFSAGGQTLDNSSRQELKELLLDVVEYSKNVETPQDYSWLREVLEGWRNAGPAIGILVDEVLLPPEQFSGGQSLHQQAWSDENLQRWVENKAHDFSKNRAIEWKSSLPVEKIIELYRKNVNAEQGFQEAKSDWHQAEVYLIADIIDGRVNFANGLGPDSYWRLEGREGTMWQHEIKKLKAYFQWKERGKGWGESVAQIDYLCACDELRSMLLDSGRKVGKLAFEPVQKYIENHYLNGDGELAMEDDRAKRVGRWVNVKAQRFLEIGVYQNNEKSQNVARDYMDKFYKNIYRAVLSSDEDSTRKVLQALGFCKGFERYEAIVNCFEIAIAIYFLNAGMSRKIIEVG